MWNWSNQAAPQAFDAMLRRRGGTPTNDPDGDNDAARKGAGSDAPTIPTEGQIFAPSQAPTIPQENPVFHPMANTGFIPTQMGGSPTPAGWANTFGGGFGAPHHQNTGPLPPNFGGPWNQNHGPLPPWMGGAAEQPMSFPPPSPSPNPGPLSISARRPKRGVY